jgi:hypothetical protein
VLSAHQEHIEENILMMKRMKNQGYYW